MNYVKNVTNNPENGKTYISFGGIYFEIAPNKDYVGAIFPRVIAWNKKRFQEPPVGWWVDELEQEIKELLEKGVNLAPNFEPVVDCWFNDSKKKRILKDEKDVKIRIDESLYEGPLGWTKDRSTTIKVLRFVKFKDGKHGLPISEWIWEENGSVYTGRFNPNRPLRVGWRTLKVKLI